MRTEIRLGESMTREEAKVKNFDVLHFVADNAGLSTFEAIEKLTKVIDDKHINGKDGHRI